MTTLVTIKNDDKSNGDVIVDGTNTCEGKLRGVPLRPGESRDIWITTGSSLHVTENWPTTPKNNSETDILSSNGASGEKWAASFVRQFPGTDEDTMRAWFANAIEAGISARTPIDPVTVASAELAELRDKAWKYDELSK